MKYVAFFRGINVGGKNKVKMDELRHLFSTCGFKGIKTYIQSGNVIFESSQEKALLMDIIAQAFAKQFGFQSNVILRSIDEISAVMSNFPFTDEEIKQAETITPDVEHVYIYFSKDAIDTAALEELYRTYDGNDKLYIGRQEIYLLCYQSIRDSKLAVLLARLAIPLTARNRKTIGKIYELLVQQ